MSLKKVYRGSPKRDRDLPRRRSSPPKTPKRQRFVYKSPKNKHKKIKVFVDPQFRSPGTKLFEKLKKLDPDARKEDYFHTREGWDIEGLIADIKLNKK